jgi:hypothetical protein
MAFSIALGTRWKLESYNPCLASILALLGIQAMLSFVYRADLTSLQSSSKVPIPLQGNRYELFEPPY